MENPGDPLVLGLGRVPLVVLAHVCGNGVHSEEKGGGVQWNLMRVDQGEIGVM